MAYFNKKVIFKSYIKGQFSFCLLLWMFRTTVVNHEINTLLERGLRGLVNYETSTFNDMLSKSKDTATHVKNI